SKMRTIASAGTIHKGRRTIHEGNRTGSGPGSLKTMMARTQTTIKAAIITENSSLLGYLLVFRDPKSQSEKNPATRTLMSASTPKTQGATHAGTRNEMFQDQKKPSNPPSTSRTTSN